jgi:hypothetical protein
MKYLSHCFVALLAVLLCSCAQSLPPLAKGAKVTFINQVQPDMVRHSTSLLGLTDGKYFEPLPGGSAMMRRIVIEEAAKAGLQCEYIESPYDKRLFTGNNTPKARLENSSAQASFVMIPQFLMQAYGNTMDGGYELSIRQSELGRQPRLSMHLVSLDWNLQKVEGKVRGSCAHYGLSQAYAGLQGRRQWENALPGSKAKVMEVFAMMFRFKVALLFGNEPPDLPSDSVALKAEL